MERADARKLVKFAVDPEPTARETRDILAHWTLRETMKRSSPQYHFLAEVLDMFCGACCWVECDPSETAVILAMAVEACLKGKIGHPGRRTIGRIGPGRSQTAERGPIMIITTSPKIWAHRNFLTVVHQANEIIEREAGAKSEALAVYWGLVATETTSGFAL